MTTTTKPASNGSTDTATATATGQPERITGMARVREAETYHITSVMNDAVSEAERLCAAIHPAVTDAYFKDVRTNGADSSGCTATETAESPEMQDAAREALSCLHAAGDYVQRQLVHSYEPPF